MMKKITATFVLFALAVQIYAQQDLTLYHMSFIPQRNILNPALQYNGTGVVGFPLLSSTGLSVSNSAFSYSDLVKHGAGGSLYLDPENMISKMSENNFVDISFQQEWLTFGFNLKNSYFGFNSTEKANVNFSYPKELIEFLWKGNGAMLGEEVMLKFGLNAIHYREYSFIYSTTIRDNFRLGMRLKYLYGMENVSTNNSFATLYTNPNSFALTATSNININTSGIEENTFDDMSFSEYAMGRKNTGYATDFGFNYKWDERVNFSLSVLDLGKMKWGSHLANYESKNKNNEFTYYGIDLNQFLSDTSGTDEVFQNLLDTLEDGFEVKTRHNAYETQLPLQVYLGTSYLINPKNSVGILNHSKKFEEENHTNISMSINKVVGNWVNLAVSYSIINKTYNNIGAGAALCLSDFRFYLVSDNLFGTVFPTRARNSNFRAGINYVFDHKTGKK